METNELARNVKTLRNRKGYSQEELAEKTGLSLRTIQRIENGETEPRGDSLKRLAIALDVTPEDIVDWTVQEDNGLLVALNLSALSFLVFPLLGVIVPLVLWVSKKGKVKNLDKTAKSILNFQITWLMVGVLWFLLFLIMLGTVNLGFGEIIILGPLPWMFFNVILTVVNAARAARGKDVKYFPKIRFIPN